MATKGTKRPIEAPKDWEDEFHRLKARYDQLKIDYNEKDQHNKLLQAKIRKLESDLSQINKQMGVPVTSRSAMAREEEDLITIQNDQIKKLKAQNASLAAKSTQLVEQLEKKKREAALMKRTASLNKKAPTKEKPVAVDIDIVPAPSKRPNSAPTVPAHDPLTDSNLLEVARKYKQRLTIAEEQLKQLQEENNHLRSKAGVPVMSGDIDNQLRDTSWRLQQLQTQYDYLVSKTSSQSESYRKSEELNEEYHQKIKDLRRALEELKYEKELSDAKADKCIALEETVQELRQTNRSLEDKIARLCEAPFISDAYGQQESRLRYEELVREREELKAKVDHLQEAVRTQYSALTSLKQHAAQLREEKDASDRRAEEAGANLKELQSGTSMLQDKLKMYSGDDGVDVESLERALTLIKRRGEAMDKLPFLEDPEIEQLVTVPALRRKLEDVQIMNLRLSEEAQRLENMLKLQSSINKDLHNELETLVRARDKDKRDLQQKAENFEEIALKRLDKIHALEAQVRQFVYGLSKNSGKVGKGFPMIVTPEKENDDAIEEETDNALLAELLNERGGDLRPDENILEIWIKGASIRDGIMTPGSSSFMVVDFFDYESQTTSLLSGQKPQWDFATTYKIIVDDFLIRYLATDSVSLELNLASQGDFTMLGKCTFPLSGLLKSRPRIKLQNYPVLSVQTGQIIANISVDIRLAIPISELYRLFLERHPTERRHIEQLSAQRVVEAASVKELATNLDKARTSVAGEDESRLYNELDIIIHRAAGLPMSSDGKPPTAYTHFQLLGHPDKFTIAVPNSNDPEFSEKFTFPAVTNDQQLRLMERSKLQVSVIDMKGEELDDKNQGLLGDIFISLAPLTDGSSIMDTFVVKNEHGNKVGELSLTMKWKYPLKKQRELGPRALSGLEVETLITAFCPGDFNEGVVDYQAFSRFADPPKGVLTTMDKLRVYCREISETQGKTSRDVFNILLDEGKPVDEDRFVERILRTQVDILPADCVSLFKFIDIDGENVITLDRFLAILNLDEIAGIAPGLQMKIRERVRDLNDRGIRVVSFFKLEDQWGVNGLVTRSEFKKVLKKMGFTLADEPDPVMGIVGVDEEGNKIIPSRKVEPVDDILNDTIGSEDDVLIPQGDMVPSSSNVTKNKDLSNFMKEQRAIFEEKKNDLQKRQQQALELESQLQSEKDDHKGVQNRNLDLYENDADHRIAISRSLPVERSFDLEVTISSATKLQSRFRGYSARKRFSETKVQKNLSKSPAFASSNDAQMSRAGSVKVSPTAILKAEDSIRSSLHNQSPPDILAAFLKLDKKRQGFVNRAQFAHVMKQFPIVGLYGEDLRASMDFFDSSNDGNRIDYNSFVRFFKYKEPELPSAVKKMQSLVFGRKSIDVFRRFDSSGTGYVKRAEMIIGLNDLGYGHIAQLIILNMLRMFEIRIEGQVDYANFVETVRENDASQALDALSLKFFVLVTSNMNSIDDEASFREWFNKMDKLRQGKFMVQHLAEFLSLQNISYPNEIVLALYNEMDAEGFGVPFSSYVKWIINYYKFSQVAGAESASYSNLSLSEIQRKTSLYRTVFMADSNAAYGIDSIVHSFAIYDWCRQDDGAIGKPLFFRGAKRVGFPFTSHELRVLAAEFAYQHNPEKVSYKHFLSWATQSPVAGSAQDSKALVPVETVKRTSGTTIKFLEKALQRGIDLLSVFGRFDSLSVGRITANEFCAVLADLGLSNVTQREALELADRFRAAVGDYILYRKIVTELLRQADELSGAADVDIVDVLKSALQNSQTDLYRLKDIFVYYDRKGNGTVSEDDLYTIFEEAKLRIRKTEVMAVADKFSVGKSASIQYGPLLRALESRLTEKLPAGRLAIGKLPEEIAMKLKSLFEQLILRGKDYRGEFDKFDETFSGCINQLDFREVLENRLGAKFSAKDIEVLEKVFRSSSDPRKLNFTKMIYMTHPRNYGRVPFDNIDSTGAAWEVAEDLRQKIRRRYEFMTPGELRRSYRHFARRKGINNVNLEDFALAIRNLGLRIAGDQERAVFNMINVTGGDAFRYNDFVVFVCDPQHLDLIWKLRRSIAKARVSEREIISALNDQDSNSSGLITAKQFSRAMKSCSIELSDSDIMRLLLRFDSEDSQRFDIEKFIKFLHGRSEEEEFLENDEVERSRGSARSLRSSVGKSTEKYVFEALKEKVEAKLDVGLTPNQIFALFDPDEKGVLDIVSLQYGARELGMTVTRADMRSVLRRMSLLIGGAVTRKSFFEGLGVDLDQYSDPDFTKSKRARLRNLEDEDDLGYRFDGRLNDDLKPRRRDIDDDLHSTRRKRYDDSADDIFDNENQLNSALANVAVQIRRKSGRDSEVNPKKELLNAFKQNSLQKRDYLNRKELIRSLESLNLRIALRDIDLIMESLDEQGRGLVDYEELTLRILKSKVDAIDDSYTRSSPSPSSKSSRSRNLVTITFSKRPDLKEDVLHAVKVASATKSSFNADLKSECKAFDIDGDGTIGKADFQRVLSRSGVRLKTSTERDFIDSISNDSRRGKEITYDDFLDAISGEIRNDDLADDVLDRLRRRISRDAKQGQDIEEIFTVMDRDGNGMVDVDEFENAMDKIGIPLTREEAKRIIARYSVNGVSIKFKEFLKAFHIATHGDDPLERILKRIRKALLDRFGPGDVCARKLKLIFSDLDTNGDGQVSTREFSSIMSQVKIDLSSREVDEIFKRYDRSGNGKLEYDEFIKLLDFNVKRTDDLVSVADEDNKQLQMKTDDLLAMIRSSVERDLGPGAKSAHRMKETFADIDIDGNGKVDNKEFEKAMKKLNVNVTFREIDLIYQRFDKDKSGFIDYKEFLELMNFQNPHISKQLKIKTDDLVEKIRTEIELELGPGATNSRRIKEIFADIDRDGNGTIDKSEFEKAMKKLNVRITFREIDMLYERFDADNSGFMSYNGFLKLLDFTAKTNKIPDKIESNSKVNDLIDKIRRSIEDYLGPGASSARRIKEVFAAIDTNNNGEIDKREFEKAMIKLRVDLTSREIDMIFEKFDYNGSRSINYEEFLRFIDFDGSRNSNNRSRSSSGVDRDGGIDPRLKMKINDLLDKIRKNLHEELGAGATSARRVKQTFDDFDLDGNGELDKREFARAMIKLRVRLTADEIDLLYDRFDKNSNGTISYSEFLVLLDLDKNDTPEGKRSY